MKFEKWVPKELCDLYNNWGKFDELPEDLDKALSSEAMKTGLGVPDYERDKQHLELLERLLTRSEMRSVWNAFAQIPIVYSDTNIPLPPGE